MSQRPPATPTTLGALSYRLALGLALFAAAESAALAQQGPATPAAQPAARQPAAKPADTRPSWAELTVSQQQALAPLAGSWVRISEAQKRKWLALSQNFSKLPAAEQARMHSRMSEWVALSPQQRTQARLNFGETQQLAPDDKKAKWEAYQALPPEQKRKLAAAAPAKTPGTAAAVKPVPAEKLAAVPPKQPGDAKPPRIAAGPTSDGTGSMPALPGATPGAADKHP